MYKTSDVAVRVPRILLSVNKFTSDVFGLVGLFVG
jgi:hypothetical protein